MSRRTCHGPTTTWSSVRQPPLPRASCQRPQGGLTGISSLGLRPGDLRLGDAVASGRRVSLGVGLRRAVATVACRLGETSAGAPAPTPLSAQSRYILEEAGGTRPPAKFAILVFLSHS